MRKCALTRYIKYNNNFPTTECKVIDRDGVHLGYIHNTMAKYKLPLRMAVLSLHIEPTAYDHHYGSSRFVLLW